MVVFELDKLKIEIEILRVILSRNLESNYIDKKGLQEFLEDKQLMFNHLQAIYNKMSDLNNV